MSTSVLLLALVSPGRGESSLLAWTGCPSVDASWIPYASDEYVALIFYSVRVALFAS